MKTQALNVLALALGMAIASAPAQAQFQKRSDLVLEQVALLENGNWLGTGDTGVYLSADQGVTWTKAAFPSQGRPGLAIATRSVVGGGLTFVGALDDGIWLSRDHGTNWTFTGPVASSFGTGIGRMAYNGTDYVAGYFGWPRGLYRWNGTGWDNTLAVHDGWSLLAAANGRFLAGLVDGGVVSSDDGGRTWRKRHPEFQLLARTANAVLGVSTSSGVVRRSDDNGDTWREEGSAVPVASIRHVDHPAVYGGALYVPVHGSGIWLRRPDLTWTRVLTNSGFCSVYVVGPSLVVASQEGVFQLTDESAFARILVQPQSLTANLGDTATFSIVATNATTFQWLKDGTPLPGATNATLTLTNVQPPRIGDYQVVAGNGFGSVTSSVATLSINGVNPGIWKGLVGYYPFDGSGSDLSGLGNHGVENHVSYAMDRFGQPRASLALSETSRPNSMVVTNALFRSGQIDFTIGVWVALTAMAEAGEIGTVFNTFPHPGIAMGFGTPGKPGEMRFAVGTGQQWASVEAFPGITGWGWNVWKHVVLAKTGSTLRQYADGQLVTEASVDSQFAVDCSLIFGSATLGGLMGETGYNYRGLLDDARIYNRALSDSEVAALYASELPPAAAIGVPPASVTGLVGGTATLSVGATNALGYQWFKDGVALDGATSTNLVLPNLRLSDAGSYWVIATNVMSRATSAPAVVVVHMPPAIVSQPLDTTVDPGGSVTLAASVASFPASVLQWFREGVPVPGATNATLVLGPVQAAGMGSYQLVASNVVGTISSQVARVTVTGADPAILGGLVAYLPFNGGVADEGAWNHPVVLQGASLATDRRGRANAAVAFNGAGDFVEIPDHPAFATMNFTVALWFNPVRRAGASGGGDAETLFSKGPGSMDLQLGTSPLGAGGIRFRPRGDGTWDTTGPAFGTNRWQHVVAVYDASGGAVQVYLDGVARPMASTGVVVPSLTTTTNGLRLGLRHDGTGGFLGRLDDVRVYARALGASDVRALLASEAAAPVIVDQPQDVRRVEGSRVTVSAGLLGERPMAFAWSQAGATRVVTGESLEFASLGRQDAGLYKLVVTNVHGTATSRAFTVDVLYGPELVFEPTDTSVNAGATVRLGAGVDGNPAPTLQWTRDGRALPGATNSTLTLAGIQVGDAGVYRLVASNEVGTVTGREVRVSVFYAPMITGQPRALTVDHGKGFEVSVEASGVPAPTFQWTRGGVALPGATNATVRVASATVGDEGEYRVEVRNDLGTIQSEPALVTVRRVAPVIGGLPGSLAVAEGEDVALAAAVEAIPSATLQWLHEGEPLPGETNATLKIARVRGVEAGRYALAATNVAGGTVREVVVGVKASWQSLGLALDTGLDVAWPWPTATGWHYQTTTSHDGEDAARSARIGGYQSSEMRLPLRGPGSLTFWWRTSCEEGWDYAEVLLDGQRKGRMTGERNWAAVRLEVPEGLHTVTWRYAKDGSTDEGEDAAWVDEVAWTPETAGVQPAWVEVVPTLEGGYQVRSMGGGAGRAVIQSSADLETWRNVVVGTGKGGVLRARMEGTEGARFFRARTGNGN